jgi:hypothetical protein
MRIGSRHGRLLLMVVCALMAGTALAAQLKISNRFSPMDRFRDRRPGTEFIILHTTEGGDRGSLDRVRRRGLAHYLVRRDGRVYRIIRRQKIALHAGRSMWDGKQNLDRRSIGIEVVGYHDKPVTDKQINALRELLRQLQGIYDIPDEKVLTHSMVAYGKPNRWHRHDHRGRKRCGMQFAQPELREKLGLTSRPLFDPDVKAGRLVEADPYLAQVLYSPDERARQRARSRFQETGDNIITAGRSAWFIARDEFDSPGTVYVFPSGTRKRGDQISDWSRLPTGTKVLLDQDVQAPRRREYLTLGRNQAASVLAGEAHDDYATVYLLPGGRLRRGDTMSEGDFRALPPGTKIFLGVEFAGKITRQTTAYRLCGTRHDHPTTLYLLPGGQVVRGNAIRDDRIPPGTLVLVEA